MNVLESQSNFCFVFVSGYASSVRSNVPFITTVRIYARSSQPMNSN